MHNENKPLLALMFLPTMKEMLVTGNAQKPHLVNLAVQSVSLQLRTDADEVVRWVED